MSISDVRHAFQRGLGSAGSCREMTMKYCAADGVDRLTAIYLADGAEHPTLEMRDVPSGGDLNAIAEAWGREIAAKLTEQSEGVSNDQQGR